MSKLLTFEEAKKILGVKSYKGFKSLLLSGLPVVEVAGLKRIDSADLTSFIEAHKVVKTK